MNNPRADRMPIRKTYEDGLQLWHVGELRHAGVFESMSDKRKLLITPEGRDILRERRGTLKTIGRELATASQFSGSPDEIVHEIENELPWQLNAVGTINNVFRRQKDSLDLAIRMKRPDPQYDTSEVPDNALQAQLLRLMKQRFGIDVVTTYFVTPDFSVMEFIDAPLAHEYVTNHPERDKGIYDQLWEIEKYYKQLQAEHYIPMESDIKSLRHDTSNSFVIEDKSGDTRIKLFDIGLGKGGDSGFPLPGQTRIIRNRTQ